MAVSQTLNLHGKMWINRIGRTLRICVSPARSWPFFLLWFVLVYNALFRRENLLDPIIWINGEIINASMIVFLFLLGLASLKYTTFVAKRENYYIVAYLLHFFALYMVGMDVHLIADGLAWVFLYGK